MAARVRAWFVDALALVATDGLIGRAKQSQAQRIDAGLTKITWEPALSGRNGVVVEQMIFNQESMGRRFPGSPAHRLGGGAEINRNVVTERVLGLPAEPRTDSLPWREVPR